MKVIELHAVEILTGGQGLHERHGGGAGAVNEDAVTAPDAANDLDRALGAGTPRRVERHTNSLHAFLR